MNEMTTIDLPSSGSALATIESTDLTAVFITPGGIDAIVSRIEADARSQAKSLDASTEKNRKALASLRYKVARSKTALDDAGKALNEGKRSEINAVDADRRSARDRLDALAVEIEKPLKDYKDAEAARIKANEDAIAAMETLALGLSELATDEIKERYRQAGIVAEFEWSIEFTARAQRVRDGVVAQLQVAHQAAKQREAEAAAEVVRQAEEAERARLAAIQAQKEREEQIARDAAEAARLAAEAKAAREAEEARQAARREREAAEAAARAETDAAARREQEALAEVERAKRAAEQAEADLLAAIERERIAAERAEINRLAEVARAEREKVEAVEAERRRLEQVRVAEEAERTRQAEAERVEAELRAENVEYRRQINREAALDLQQHIQLADGHSLPSDIVQKIIVAVAKGEIRHITIGY